MMTYKNIILFFLATLSVTPLIRAQQEASFSLYMFNHQSINPAYVGAQDYTQITVLNRSQWNGIDGSPETQAINFGHQFENKNLGIGFSGVMDKIGPIQNTNASIDLSYHLRLNDKKLKLGLGLKFSGRSYQTNNSMISLFDSSDNVFSDQTNNKFTPNIGAGLYLHNQNFYIGIGVPYLLEDKDFAYKRNNYLFFGGLLSLNQSIQLKPSFLIQNTESSPETYDASVLIVANNMFWIGPQIRTTVNSGIPNYENAGFYGLIAGIHVGKNMTIGYSYQGESLNKNIGIVNNSHELLLRFQFTPKPPNILRSPRLF